MNAPAAPSVILLAGPNGAGKSTVSQKVLSGFLGVPHFVNADTIARGLSAFRSEEMAIKAGRVMLNHLHDLAAARADFALETTLASKTFAPWIADLRAKGYAFHLIFVWVPSPDVSVARVRDRVSRGGHDIPEETIRRRYQRGLDNFFRLYLPLADHWKMFDNGSSRRPRLIAEKTPKKMIVHDLPLWESLEEVHRR